MTVDGGSGDGFCVGGNRVISLPSSTAKYRSRQIDVCKTVARSTEFLLYFSW
jgi:hypothetical protein